MRLPDGCRLMLPGFDSAFNDRIYLYDIQALIDLRQSDQDLTGHPGLDLENGVTAGWVEVGRAKLAKINRWQEQDRLLRVRRNAGGSYYIGYVERRQWKHLISDEDWHWIEANCETSLLVSQERYAAIALDTLGQALATIGLAASKQVKQKQKKRQRKERRRQEREEQAYGQHIQTDRDQQLSPQSASTARKRALQVPFLSGPSALVSRYDLCGRCRRVAHPASRATHFLDRRIGAPVLDGEL